MKHFNLTEFACPCCGACDMDEHFLSMLDHARELAGIPFVINSGKRCERHNKSVGGVSRSKHLTGEAADIRTDTQRERAIILRALLGVGFRSIAIAKTFLHVDTYSEDWCGLY